MASKIPLSFFFGGTLRVTLALTQKCNLDCDYCYVGKKDSVMPLSTARKIVDFIFENTRDNDEIDVGFFGGEPFLEFDLLKKVTCKIQSNGAFGSRKVKLSVTTNGTILTKEILDFLLKHHVFLFMSCDGPPEIQDHFRHFSNGKETSGLVEENLKKAVRFLPIFGVNSVYSPENLRFLPETVDYFLSLGVRMIYLSPNISAEWTRKEADMLPEIYDEVGKRYVNSFALGKPIFISLIDGKIVAILKGGYKPEDMCKMGKGEYAFAPTGNVYPCERLIGSDDGKTHCLGNISNKSFLRKGCGHVSAINRECLGCSLRDYCMNWCGCSNYYFTGMYNMVSPFTCSSEKAAIKTAFTIIQDLENFNILETNWRAHAKTQYIF